MMMGDASNGLYIFMNFIEQRASKSFLEIKVWSVADAEASADNFSDCSYSRFT